jgi:hypothetical protein
MFDKREYKAGEFELVLEMEFADSPWRASIYKAGGQIPLRRKSHKTERGCLRWFDAFLTEREQADLDRWMSESGANAPKAIVGTTQSLSDLATLAESTPGLRVMISQHGEKAVLFNFRFERNCARTERTGYVSFNVTDRKGRTILNSQQGAIRNHIIG